MKFLALCISISLFTACSTLPSNTLTQVATINSLLAGVYDGEVTLGEIAAKGDFGLGTYQALDGEMVLLDGVFYQIKYDGSVHQPSSETLSPFATVVNFEPTFFAKLSPFNLEALKSHLDKLIPDQNQFVAIRIDGHFATMRTRSVPAQVKPYRPLDEVVKTQAVFDFKEVKGTLVGIRCPPYMNGLNVVGYHFHFLTENRDAGGHVLSFDMTLGKLAADTLTETFVVMLPTRTQAGGIKPSQDRRLVLEAVEKY